MNIPPILHNDNLIFDDIERTNLFNIYFSKQSDSNSNIPNLSHGILFVCLIILRILQDNNLDPPLRIVTSLLGIEDSVALRIALVISFVINSISSVRKETPRLRLKNSGLAFHFLLVLYHVYSGSIAQFEHHLIVHSNIDYLYNM
jgi:hypothetical protein